MTDVLTVIFLVLGFLAAVRLFPEIQSWIDDIKLKRFNNKYCIPISKERDPYLKQEYGIEFEEPQPFLIGKTESEKPHTEEHDAYTLILLRSEYWKNAKDISLDALTLILLYGVRKPVLDELKKKGLDIETAEEISTQATQRFIERLDSKIVKSKSSKDRLKVKISENDTNSPKKEIIRKESERVKKLIRENYSKPGLKDKFNNYLANNREYTELMKDDVGEILKIKQRLRKIKEDSVIETVWGKEIKFGRHAKDKMTEIKAAFLSNHSTFIRRVKKIDCRSEQIFALILAYPGRYYELEMSRVFDIPQSTVSNYAERMDKDLFIIKDTYSAKGNYVYLFPYFTLEDIKWHIRLINKSGELALIGKIFEKKSIFSLEGYEELRLLGDRLSSYLGNRVFVRGKLNLDASLSISFISIIEPEGVQTSLPRFMPIF